MTEPKRYWRKVSVFEAFQIAAERGVGEEYDYINHKITFPNSFDSFSGCIVILADNSIIVSSSVYETDYYDGINICEPKFAIGDVRKPKEKK